MARTARSMNAAGFLMLITTGIVTAIVEQRRPWRSRLFGSLRAQPPWPPFRRHPQFEGAVFGCSPPRAVGFRGAGDQFELALDAPVPYLDGAGPVVRQVSVGRDMLEATYFDTVDRRLADAGLPCAAVAGARLRPPRPVAERSRLFERRRSLRRWPCDGRARPHRRSANGRRRRRATCRP